MRACRCDVDQFAAVAEVATPGVLGGRVLELGDIGAGDRRVLAFGQGIGLKIVDRRFQPLQLLLERINLRLGGSEIGGAIGHGGRRDDQSDSSGEQVLVHVGVTFPKAVELGWLYTDAV